MQTSKLNSSRRTVRKIVFASTGNWIIGRYVLELFFSQLPTTGVIAQEKSNPTPLVNNLIRKIFHLETLSGIINQNMSKLQPIVWEIYDNYKIRDIKRTEYQQVADFIWKYSISVNPVYGCVGVNADPESKDAFDLHHKYILKSDCSLVVIDSTEEDNICGVILQCPMLQSLRSWTNFDHLPGNKVLLIFNYIFRDLIRMYQKKTGREDTFHIFNVVVPLAMKGNSWKIKLFNASYRVAASMRIPRLTFVALLKEDQVRAERFKFEDHERIFYPNYVEPESNELIFNAFYKANTKEQYIILYDKEVVPAQRYNDMVPK